MVGSSEYFDPLARVRPTPGFPGKQEIADGKIAGCPGAGVLPQLRPSKLLTRWLPGVNVSFPIFRSTQERSEEHTSELQSRGQLVCRLLPEKKQISRDHGGSVVNDC